MGCHFSKISVPRCELQFSGLLSELRSSSLISEFQSSSPKLEEFLLNNQNPLFYRYLNNAVETKKLLAWFKHRISEARSFMSHLECYQDPDQNSYSSQTLDRLREFMRDRERSAGVPAVEFTSLCEHLQSMVTLINSKKDEIERQLSSTKKWKTVWKFLHNTVFMSLLVLGVILAALSAPLWATAAATAAATAIKAAEPWIDSIWTDRLDALKNEKDVVLMTIKGNNVFGIRVLESFRAMWERLEIRIESVSDIIAGLELLNYEGEEITCELMAREIGLRVGEIGKSIDKVEMKVNACEGEIEKTVYEFLNAIINE